MKSATAALVLLLMSGASVTKAEEPEIAGPAWTRSQLIRELQFHPDDPFLQFALLQLSTTQSEFAEAEAKVTPGPRVNRGVQRTPTIDLYSIFSGSLAVQESLQLNALGDGRAGRGGQPTVTVDSLEGPTVRSHPWVEMLGGQSPSVSQLAQCVPEDHLFVRFRSVRSLFNSEERFNTWYGYATGQGAGRIRTVSVMEELQNQWQLQIDRRLMLLYEATVDEVALTSSDLFFGEGTDATVIMRLSRPGVIRPALDQALRDSAERISDATLTTGSLMGVDFTHVTTPDRSVHVYAADPTDDLHVRSNSKLAFRRILQTILREPTSSTASEANDGQDEVSGTRSLADSPEFQYIRTLLPVDSELEDGFVYLSDPFIRKLIGPQKKLTQRNRLVCRSQLRLLRHAQLLYRTQHGRAAASIAELRRGGCLGHQQAPMELVCPSGGDYAIGRELTSANCTHHGFMDHMIPCCEIPVEEVPTSLASEYRSFVRAYSRFWQTFFDPIAIRLQLRPKTTRVETLVLPLINNSIYSGLADALGGEPQHLGTLPIAGSNIASLAVKLDKETLLRRFGISTPVAEEADADKSQAKQSAEAALEQATRSLGEIGLAMHKHHSTFKRFPPRRDFAKQVDSEHALSWRVQILPFLGELELYQRFRPQEPWDSPHNRELIKEMPQVFSSGSSSPQADGETRFVLPRHPKSVLPDSQSAVGMRDIIDGSSNTIMVVLADDPVIWTRPENLDVDLERPKNGWSDGIAGAMPVLMADGSTVVIPQDFAENEIAKLLTVADTEVLEAELPMRSTSSGRRSRSSRAHPLNQLVERLDLAPFLYRGIGDQIAFHLCDEEPLVELNVSRMVGSFAGTGMGGGFGSVNSVTLGMLATAVNSPVYVSVPVEDPHVVDETLENLDQFLAELVHRRQTGWPGFFNIEQDAYTIPSAEGPPVRGYGFRFGPIKWRFYWSRIGDGLYLASRRGLIDELRNAHAAEQRDVPTPGDEAHATVRVRPKNWQQVLAHYRIGWAESERHACIANLPPLSQTARAVVANERAAANQTDGGDKTGSEPENLPETTVRRLAERLFEGPLQCPNDGSYQISASTGNAVCSLHGSASQPRQPAATGDGRIARIAESVNDLQLSLTFMEEGLRAVAVIQHE